MGFRRSPPPFLSLANNSLTDKTNHQIMRGLRGVNFASGGSGVLDSTGSTITLSMQVQYFATIQSNITARTSKETAEDVISRSAFLISTGGNDIFAFFSQNNSPTNSQKRRFTATLVSEYTNHVKEWGIDPSKRTAPSSSTTRYIDFLIATASGNIDGGKGPGKIVTPFEKTKIAAYTVGAMTPCMRLFAYLGNELQVFLQNNGNHPYKKWIENYSSRAFEDAAVKIEDLLDNLSVSLTGEELELIGKLFQQSMKLQIEFFSSQQIAQPSIVPLANLHDLKNRLIVFSDFDLTCTVVDSSAILAEIDILTAQKADQGVVDGLIARKSSSDMRNSWNMLSKQFTEEYEECIEKLLSSQEAKAFDYDRLRTSLQLLSDFENRANSRVISSGLLKGMKLDDIKKAGERLNLQDGCTKFFQNLVKIKEKLNADLHILSYCWCADLIRSAFSSGDCIDLLNEMARRFNRGVGSLMQNLSSTLRGFKYSIGSSQKVVLQIIRYPDAFGYQEVKTACCGAGRFNGNSGCTPNATYCSNRRQHLFWDLLHPTHATSRLAALAIFNSSAP